MPRTTAAILLLALLAATAWIAVASSGVPVEAVTSAPSGAFSSERAMEHVHALARAPRPAGSAAHDRAREYLVGALRDLGLEPQVQEGVAASTRFYGPTVARVRNVVVRLPGLDDDPRAPAVLLLAHYDSVQAGPGASDDAVGVAVLLETLRALREGQVPRHDVIALFTDAEELGLLGAEAFARDHPWADRIGVVLNFEARGTRGPAIMFETGADNGWLIERFAEAVPNPIAASYSYEVYRRLPNDTDYTVFRRRGVPGLNFAHIHGAIGYHTVEDSIERLDPASLQHHGETALALARALGDADLGASAPAGDAVYFNPFGSTFVHFPAAWVPVLAVVLALAALAALALGLRRRAFGLGGLLGGLLAWLAATAAAVGLGTVSVPLLFRVFYDFRIWGDGSSVAWTLFGWIVLILGLAALVYALARRWLGAPALAAGGLLLWTLLSVAASFAAPGASYLFLVPLAFQLPAAFWLLRPAGEPREGAPGDATSPSFAGWAALALGGVGAALIWAPTLGLVAVGLQFGSVVAAAALALLLSALLAPQLELLASPALGRRWLLGVVLVAAGLVLLVVVRGAAGFGPGSPHPTSLLYALDADRSEAYWVSLENDLSPWTREALGPQTERAPLPGFLGGRFDVARAPAPRLELPAPEVTVDAPGDDGRYRARVVPPAGAARLRLVLTADQGFRSVRVDGQDLDPRVFADRDLVSVLYVAPRPEGIVVEVATTGDGGGGPAPELSAVAQWLSLPDAGEAGPPPRGPGQMPTGRSLDADVTLVRTAVRLDAASAPVPEPEAVEEASPPGADRVE